MVIEKTQYGGLSLANADIGDVLMVSAGNAGDLIKVSVTGVTKTRIKTSDNRSWMRDSLRQIGSDTWSRTYICEFDQEKWEVSRDKQEHKRLVRELNEGRLSRLPLADIRRIWAIACGMEDAKDLPSRESI